MQYLDYSMKKRRGWSTAASSSIDLIHVVFAQNFAETPTGLPAAGDIISVAELFGGLTVRNMKVWIPDGKLYAGGATDFGWKLAGNYPGHDQVQNPYHSTPNVTGVAPVEELDCFGAAIAPVAGVRTELLTGDWKQFQDYEHNGHQDFRNYHVDITITPSAAPALDDELFIELEYMLDSK